MMTVSEDENSKNDQNSTFSELVARQKHALARRYPYADSAVVELIAHELARLREEVANGSIEKSKFRETGDELIAMVSQNG